MDIFDQIDKQRKDIFDAIHDNQPTVFDVLAAKDAMYKEEAERMMTASTYGENLVSASKILRGKDLEGRQLMEALVKAPQTLPAIRGKGNIADIARAPKDLQPTLFNKYVHSRTDVFKDEEIEQLASLSGPLNNDAFQKALYNLSVAPGPEEYKEEETRKIVRSFSRAAAGRIQASMQAEPNRRAADEWANEQRKKFGAKTWNRWDRSAAMVVGGGLHLAEELERIVTLGRYGDTAAEWAEIYNDVLQRPEMQPVVDNWFDKYVGGAVEISAPVLTMIAEAVATKQIGTMYPKLATASAYLGKSSMFLSTYGIESNSIYQTARREGMDESEARLRGVMGGLVNAGIELGGGSGVKYTRKAIIDAAVKKHGRFKYFTRKTLRTALAEGLAEELPQEMVSMVMGDDIPRLEDGQPDWGKVADRMIDTAIVGSVLGGVLAGPHAAYEAYTLPSFTEGEVVPVSGTALSIPGRTYAEAKFRAEDGTNGKNPWIKQDVTKTNRDRVLLVQFASDLLTEGTEDPAAKAYYDKLYESRPGYARLGDTWEIPKWITEASFFVPNSDVYFVRDMDEAKRFLKASGYQKIMFSALDINTPKIQELVKDFPGKAVIGGYIGGKEKAAPAEAAAGKEIVTPFSEFPNVTWYDSMPDMAKGEGYEYKAGVNMSHFEGSPVIPRLCLSKGCKHRCAFCVVSKTLEEMPQELAEQQADAFANLDAKLAYLDDKTFGQAKNHMLLPDLYWRIKKNNPEFDGFIIQTTAAQFGKFSDEFVANSHIRYVELGVESYNDAILGSLRKPHNTRMIDAAAEKARRLRINLIPNIIIGLPQETAETYARTLAWLEANKDIISHVNAYNLALYEGTDITKLVYGEDAKVKAEDINENAVAKSFHKDPQLHADFADRLYQFSNSVLDHPPLEKALTADQAIGAKYGLEPGKVDVVFKQAEDRYRELKAKKDRKGRVEDQPDIGPDGIRWTREPGRYWYIKGKTPNAFKQWWNSLNSNERKATRIAVKPLGLKGNWRVTIPGDVPVRRVLEGEAGELAFLSRNRNDLEAILADLTSDNPILSFKISTGETPTTRPVKELKEMAHGMARQLGMTEEERRLLMVDLTGKETMTKMEAGEMEQTVQYLEAMLTERGMKYEPQPAEFYEMLDLMHNKKRADRIEVAEDLPSTLRKMGQGLRKAAWKFVRMDRFFEWLDGSIPDGIFKKTFYRKVERSHTARNDAINNDVLGRDAFMKTVGIDPHKAVAKRQRINANVNLTASERVAFFNLSLNEAGQNRLANNGFTTQDVLDVYKFMGLTDDEIELILASIMSGDRDALHEIIDNSNSAEVKLAGYDLQYYENFWPLLKRVAISVGVDEKTLNQEFMHSPIVYRGVEMSEQPSLLDLFDVVQFTVPGVKTEQGFLKAREKNVSGRKIELDSFVIFNKAASDYNSFLHMAPVAYSLNQMLGNEQFSSALDAATQGWGTDMVRTWLKHSVRGHGDGSSDVIIKMIMSLRESSMVYALAMNVLSVARQALQLSNAVAVDYRMPAALAGTFMEAFTGGYTDMYNEVMSKSATVRNRRMEEFHRQARTAEQVKAKYKRVVKFDEIGYAALIASDSLSVTTSWMAAYRIATQHGLPDPDTGIRRKVSEEEAIAFADESVTKNQSMADAVYLPDVMRNGSLSVLYKLFLPFTNQVNNNLNLFTRDNLDPIRRRGVLGAPSTAWKYLFTWVVPALAFGIIQRGRFQRDKKEIAKDLFLYPAAGIFLVSDMLMALVEDEGKRSAMYESGTDSFVNLVRGVKNGNVRSVVKNAARTIGLIGGAAAPGMRGVINAQVIRSAEAAWDMVTGEEEPSLRKLIYGKHQLKKYEGKEEKEGIRR